MGERIRIRGVVQGVGFRPAVARIARRLGVSGFVRNDGDGVLIGLAGESEQRQSFVDTLLEELPPLARVDAVERQPDASLAVGDGFEIETSAATHATTEVACDAAVCVACAEEIFDPYARRYRYPLATCTQCGPRYSIAVGLPFDRATTTMADFDLCAACAVEYGDETDRRYHAQAMACGVCGPQVKLHRADGRAFSVERYSMLDAVDAVGSLLMMGEIVAVKGLGSYHLCCDATNAEAVAKLRARKRRLAKPFALMAKDAATVERYAVFDEASRTAFESPAAPIVLLPRRTEAENVPPVESTSPAQRLPPLAPEVAPGQSTLGFMRPYTPIHLLMLRRMKRPIVCTSGNLSHEPPCIDDDAARAKLGQVADWFLVHERPIRNRVDDSVVRSVGGIARTVRRARGLAPETESLPPGLRGSPKLLACGGQLKSTFALVSDGRAAVSPHLGDLDHLEAFAAYEQTYALMRELYQHRPEVVVVDRHPEYRATQWGRAMAEQLRWPLIEVQHHHAHVAAVMAEHGYPVDGPPVLGVAIDGLGYGDDGTLWGGEFLLASYARYVRMATFKPVAMLGGDLAARQPWRSLYAHLRAAMPLVDLKVNFGDLPVVQRLLARGSELLEQALQDPALSPLSSSGGRLFDAVSAAVGLCFESQDYEGQAPIELEAAVTAADIETALAGERYPIGFPKHPDLDVPYFEFRGLWTAVLGDLYADVPPGLISARFHVALSEAIARMADVVRRQEEGAVQTVALGGGCFQNKYLLELTAGQLEQLGFDVLTPVRLPANDGGLAFGQAAVAAAQLKR